MNTTIQQAEEILDEYRTRENAVLNGDAHIWDVAYQIAFDAYKAVGNMHVNGQLG